MLRRLAVALLLFLWTPPTHAHADWLITPFLGTSFRGKTTFLIPQPPCVAVTCGSLEEGAGRKMTLGASVALLTDGILGLEADIGHTPRFFEGNNPLGLVLTSRVTTVSGNVIVAAPLALSRESLRPYLVGGLGLMQARSKHVADLFPVEEDLLGLSLGAGAIGFVTERTGLRFDLRHFKAITPFARSGVSRLSFWRISVGATVRY